jgi:hypothetical protein
MAREVPVREREGRAQEVEVRAVGLDEHRQDAEPRALMDDVVELGCGMTHGVSSRLSA